jgi:hypothetical protein
MNKELLTIDDFDTNINNLGECIAVDYQESVDAGHSLESYHPEVLCDQDEKFLASTYKENSTTIRLYVKGKWADEIKTIINSLYFTLNSRRDKIVGTPNSRPHPINGWYLYRWEMELVNHKGCPDENIRAFKDTLFWVRYDLNAIYDLHKLVKNINDVATNQKTQFLNDLLVTIDKTRTEITTTWHWRNNK